VIHYFEERTEKLLVLNIEDADFAARLARFLGTERSIAPTQANRNGHGSKTWTMLESIGEKMETGTSERDVRAFFLSHGLDQHSDNITFFESPSFRLSRSASDYFLIVLPFLRPLFRRIYTALVASRSKARSFLAKWLVDSFIRFFRSESDMRYFTPVRRLGSGSK
jgi:hypothetical protein